MTKENKMILQFSEIRNHDLALVGGKGANLGELYAIGIPVPDGFCITTFAFDQFLSCNHSSQNIYEMLDTIVVNDLEMLREVGKKVRAILQETPIPQQVRKEIKDTLVKFGDETVFAVRSSATAEDLPEASFAGQQDTYLNVRGIEEILTAVKKCWISLFNDRAILYRIKNKFSHRDVKLSVIIQKMVMSEKAGIMFTAHPVTGHRQILTIDASYGLGEAIVSGVVSPDSYVVDKRTNKILEKKISEKKIAILPSSRGGTKKTEIKGSKRHQSVLSKTEVLKLTEIGREIECHYGVPQDIEWGIEHGVISILQTRPITSLYPIDGLKYPKNKLGIFFSVGHQQNMTRTMTPLSMSTIKIFMPPSNPKNNYESIFIRESGSRLFLDITLALRHFLLRRLVLNLLSQMDALSPQAIKQVTKHKEFKRNPKPRITISMYYKGLKQIKRLNWILWNKELTGFVDQVNGKIDEYIETVSTRLDNESSYVEKIKIMNQALVNVFSFILETWISEAVVGLLSARILKKLAQRWLSAQELEDLVSGIPHNVVTEMNIAISDLADIARRSPELRMAFHELGEDGNLWIQMIKENIKDSKEFMSAWERFISKYGARGASEIDLFSPKWYEDPLPVLKVIQSYLEREEGYLRKQQQLLYEKRERAMKQLLDKAGQGILGNFRTRKLMRLYQVMLEVGGMREHHKFMVVRLFAVIKENVKEIAQALVYEHKLQTIDDIWFLTWEELKKMVKNDDETDWNIIIQKRKKNIEQYSNLTPPLIITSDGESPVVSYNVKGAPKNALLGNPVSPGIVEGRVHIIRDPRKESLAPNEILVAEFTDPGWTPLFINAKGLILEIGGALTHGAVVAREYSIPAVVGVREATKRLKTGDRVRLDGNRGIIEKI